MNMKTVICALSLVLASIPAFAGEKETVAQDWVLARQGNRNVKALVEAIKNDGFTQSISLEIELIGTKNGDSQNSPNIGQVKLYRVRDNYQHADGAQDRVEGYVLVTESSDGIPDAVSVSPPAEWISSG
jgi:hypothetical protein